MTSQGAKTVESTVDVSVPQEQTVENWRAKRKLPILDTYRRLPGYISDAGVVPDGKVGWESVFPPTPKLKASLNLKESRVSKRDEDPPGRILSCHFTRQTSA